MHSEDANVGTAPQVPTDDQVRAMTRMDASGNVPDDVKAWLRAPENLDRWRLALTVEAQTTQQAYTDWRATVRRAKAQDWALYQAEMTRYSEWAAKAGRWTQHVNGRITECRRLQRERDEAARQEFRGALEERVAGCEWNIARLNRAVRAIAEAVKSGQAVDA